MRVSTSIIHDHLLETNNEIDIEEYELQPFEICVQALERTLVDKLFAICDYAIGNRIERNSRHIYDISCLITKVCFDKKLKELIKNVRTDRKLHVYCYSARDGISIPKILSEIIKSNIYKKDYETITKIMMYKYVPYEEAIKALETIVSSGIFEVDN